jgi:hypothetical protein
MLICQTLVLREENRLRVFGSKREERAGDWRRLRSEELHNLFASPNTIG